MRTSGTPGQAVDCAIDSAGNRAMVVAGCYPKDWYSWADRTVTSPDVSGSFNAGALTPADCSDSSSLVAAIEGNAAGATIGLLFVFWDKRGNPLSVVATSVTLSSSVTNNAGNYIGAASSSPSGLISGGFLTADVSCVSGYNVLVTSMGGATSVILHTNIF